MFRVDIGNDPTLRRTLLQVTTSFTVVRDAGGPKNLKERIAMGFGVVGSEQAGIRSTLDKIGTALKGTPPSVASVLESGIHVNEILAAGYGLNEMRAIGMRSCDMLELGWVPEREDERDGRLLTPASVQMSDLVI